MAGISPHCKEVLSEFEEKTKEKCYDFRAIRAVVMCQAWKTMEEEKVPFSTAIKRAWQWAKTKCKEI